jgi:hypothetical protein
MLRRILFRIGLGMASVQCRSTDSIMGVEAQGKESMNVLSQGTPEELCRPCADCGLFTGRFCDGEEFEASGKCCFAAERIPSEIWVVGQRTPLCSECDWKHGKCRFCRGIITCAFFPHRCASDVHTEIKSLKADIVLTKKQVSDCPTDQYLAKKLVVLEAALATNTDIDADSSEGGAGF